MHHGFYTDRWQVCPQGARRQRNIRSKAWFRSRGCSKNAVFRQPQKISPENGGIFRFAGGSRRFCVPADLSSAKDYLRRQKCRRNSKGSQACAWPSRDKVSRGGEKIAAKQREKIRNFPASDTGADPPAQAAEIDSLIPIGHTVGIQLHAAGVLVTGVNAVQTPEGEACPARGRGHHGGRPDRARERGPRWTRATRCKSRSRCPRGSRSRSSSRATVKAGR